MNQSDIHLLDLPDEILLYILKKLDNIEVLYSLLDTNNNRLDIIAQDKIFTNNLNFVSSENNSIDTKILDRFCSNILPRIHHNVKYLTIESTFMERIFLTANFQNLTHLKLFKFEQDIVLQFFKDKTLFEDIFKQQITNFTLIYNDNNGIVTSLKDYTINVYAHMLIFFKNLQYLSIHGSSISAYPGLSLCDLPSTILSSLILTSLCINVSTFDDCRYLLDGRLNQLNTLIVRIYDLDAPSLIVHNKNNLFNLKYFSLTCHSHINTYDNRVVPLLHRMINLQKLTLCLTVRNRNGLIDGNHLQNEILIHMPFLHTFTFDIRTWNIIDNSVHCLSNDDIQQTFIKIGYQQVGCSIRYFLSNSVLCHVFTLPFTFDYLQCITNNFPIVSFNHVLYLSVCDTLPFEHEFFIRIAQAFPLLKHLTVTNSTAQTCQQKNDNNQSYLIVKFKHLTYLSVMNSDISYTEQFLLETKTYLPCLTELRVNYEQLKIVTENFTRHATRFNCTKIKQLITEESTRCIYLKLIGKMSSNTYKNVLLVGAGDDVSKNILPLLLADLTFNVTETAINADVKWIIPFLFGADYEDPSAATIPTVAAKINVIKLLKKNQSSIAHTFISTGLFLVWAFDHGFDISNHTAVLYDEGKNRTSGTTLSTVAKTVVTVIHHPELTLNKSIFIADATFTQQEALVLLEKYTNTKWTVKHVTVDETRKEVAEKLAKGNFPAVFGGYIMVLAYSGLKANIFGGRTSNKDLGVPTISLDQIIKEAVERKTGVQ